MYDAVYVSDCIVVFRFLLEGKKKRWRCTAVSIKTCRDNQSRDCGTSLLFADMDVWNFGRFEDYL